MRGHTAAISEYDTGGILVLFGFSELIPDYIAGEEGDCGSEEYISDTGDGDTQGDGEGDGKSDFNLNDWLEDWI